MRYVYADNSATTALSPKVLEKMMPYLTEVYGNPSSIYTIGAKAKAAVETARENIAKNLGAANPNEIYFTSGGSESDNWAKSTSLLQSLSITLFFTHVRLLKRKALRLLILMFTKTVLFIPRMLKMQFVRIRL